MGEEEVEILFIDKFFLKRYVCSQFLIRKILLSTHDMVNSS